VTQDPERRRVPPPDDHLRLVQGDGVPPESLETSKFRHAMDAVDRLSRDYSDAPTFGYPDLVRITGPLLPGSLIVVLARKKMGKTTFLMNVASRWLRQGHGFAYFGTEETADTAMLRFAAIRRGYDPGAVIAGLWEDISEPAADPTKPMPIWPAQVEISAELHALRDDLPAYFAPEVRPSTADIRRVAKECCQMGLPILVLDHFHRMAQEGDAQTSDLAESVRQIKQVAVKYELIVVMAAQAGRAKDPLQQFGPPPSDGGMGTSALEQECDMSLGLFRPLRRLPKKDVARRLKDFIAGDATKADVLEPHTMGVRVLDHRRNGDLSGLSAFLHCEKGMVAPKAATGLFWGSD
jgi:replicative DNA helicase